MRILHIEDQFFPTSGYQLNFLTKYNEANGNDTFILCSDTPGSWGKNGLIDESYFSKADQEYSARTGVKIIRLGSRGYISGRAILSIGEILGKIREISPDIILVHGNDTLTAINILRHIGKIGAPVIMDSHMLDIASKNKFNKLFRSYYRYFVTPVIKKNGIKIVGVEPACNEFMNKRYGIPYENLEMIPLGYDPDIFYRRSEGDKSELRKKFGFEEDEFIFIYTGKISPEKKVHLFAEAFKDRLGSDVKRAALILVGNGSGDYFEKVRSILAGSENKVAFLDVQPVDKLNELYNLADAAVWPGASSLSMFDAQACGLPVIAEGFDVNINRLSHGNGFVYAMDDVKDLRKKIENVFYMGKEDYAKMVNNAIGFVQENHSYKRISERFEELMADQIRK